MAEARAAADVAINFEGPSAIVFKSPCIQLFRGLEPVCVDQQKCVGCGRCDTVCPEYISYSACINKLNQAVRAEAGKEE